MPEPDRKALDWSDEELEALSQVTPQDVAEAQVWGRRMPQPGAGGLEDPGKLADAEPEE